MAQELSVRQIQTTSQRVIQTNRLLQMSASELDVFLQNESETNPLLEFIEDPEYHSRRRQTNHDAVSDDIPDTESGEQLSDYLNAQIMQTLSAREQFALNFLISSIDHNGYLNINIPETAAFLNVRQDIILRLIRLIRSLEPAGIGASDLAECLEIQLKRQEYDDPKLYLFVRKGLPLLAENKIRKLRELLACDDEDIREYVSVIRSLNPRPGSGFISHEKEIPIIPDIIIDQTDTGFEVRFNTHLYRQIRIQEEYRSMYRSAGSEEKAYMKDKMQRIRLMQRSIAQREQLLNGLAELILSRQIDFFTLGEGHLSSLRMQEAADDLHVHVSTISRAVSGKYLQCEHGIYPLKYFFVQGKENQPVRTDIRSLIVSMIREEDPYNPLSDDEISRRLNTVNITAARRTVAKYRTASGIPGCRVRKKHG